MSNYHETVLKDEAIELLRVKKDAWYVDGTLGGGGHTLGILERGGKVLGIDRDQDALDFVESKFRSQNSEFKIDKDFKLVRGNFADLEKIVRNVQVEKVAGILFDFGISSHQLDTSERGFSFKEGPLDMRMDQRLSVTARDLIHGLSAQELQKLFERLGEERFAKRIATQIVRKRENGNIRTTTDLVQVIGGVVPFTAHTVHPATRVFQALRIAVNDELHSIEDVLPQAQHILESSGRIVAISFHSLEDRIVKHTFLDFEKKGFGTILTKKPVLPTEEEIARNPRSRSAKLRAFEKF